MQVWQDTFKELKGQYVHRSIEKVEHIDSALRKLAKTPSDVTVIRDLMNQFQWLGGSGNVYGFPQVSKLGQHGERFCEELLQENRRVEQPDWDRLRSLLESIQSCFSDLDDQRVTIRHELLLPGKGTSKRSEILVVDEDQDSTIIISRLLEEHRLGLKTCRSAADAMALMNEKMPAGVIVVLPLSDSSGYELVEQMRALEGGDKPPILVVSNTSGFLDKVQAIHCGADGYFEVPVDWDTLMARLRYLLERNNPSMYRILSVEDDPDQAQFIKAVLESAGYTVQMLADPQFFEEALLAVQPDLVLLDVMLPNITGFELARYMRSDERYATMPILFLTTQNALEAHIESARAGGDDHLVKPIAPQLLLSAVASRLERARFLKTLLHRDGLTKLLTHACFMEEAEAVVAQCKRNPSKLATMLIVDLDNFKQVNQQYGYQTGDRVLTCLASLMRQRMRQSDRVGRYAGEELICIVEDLEEMDAVKLASRLLEDFSGMEHKAINGSTFKATFSAGLCTFEPQAMDLDRWLKLTDQAVKAAKNAGKNRVMKAHVTKR